MIKIAQRPHCKGFRKSFARLFLLTLATTVLAKGASLLPGYSIDDYGSVVDDAPSLALLLYKKGRRGRFGSALLNWLLHFFQLDPAHAKFFFTVCALVATALFAALVVRYWNLDRKGWLAPAMAAIVANHPYTAEIFTFRMSLGVLVFPFAILSLLLAPRRWSPRGVAMGSLLFAVALSIYQVALHYLLMIVGTGAAIWLARYLLLGRAAGWPRRVVSLFSLSRLVRHRNSALFAIAIFGTGLYSALTIVLTRVLGVSPASRTEILPISQWGERAWVVARELYHRLLAADPLLSHLTQGMLLLVLLAALAGLFLHRGTWLAGRPWLLATTVTALLFASLLWSLGVLLLLTEFWPATRVLSHIGVFWAGTLAIAYLGARRWARAALGALAVLIVLSFIGANNRIFSEQLRLNLRDAAKANRIIARLEAMPGFEAVDLLAIDGVRWDYPARFGTTDHDMNISAFGATWAQGALLSEISGYRLEAAEDEPNLAVAAAYCRTVKPWPGPQSITIQGHLAILCLGPERGVRDIMGTMKDVGLHLPRAPAK
ncbi:MAG TPA: glucosyltransferase domain-containing protein [Thermoanaerobaculia bacterium]|nr:glucosyltransferase domain-containing protein [Thermoanaerobaculia bacterium]